MDRQPDEAGSSFSDLADMKTHSDAHPPVEWPRFLFNPAAAPPRRPRAPQSLIGT